MRIVILPAGFVVLLTGLLAACGSGAAIGGYGPARAATNAPATAPSAPGTPPAAVSPGPSPTAVPSAATTVVPVPPPPVPVSPAPPMMARATSQALPLVAVGDPGARGSVTVTTESGRAAISVVAGGLPAGSLHSVHLHFGNCPSAGSHILVLGMLRADASGSGSLTASVNAVFTGPGHFVIIYIGPSAGPLGACANLG